MVPIKSVTNNWIVNAWYTWYTFYRKAMRRWLNNLSDSLFAPLCVQVVTVDSALDPSRQRGKWAWIQDLSCYTSDMKCLKNTGVKARYAKQQCAQMWLPGVDWVTFVITQTEIHNRNNRSWRRLIILFVGSKDSIHQGKTVQFVAGVVAGNATS